MRARVGRVRVYSRELGVSTPVFESRAFSARAAPTKGRAPSLNEVTWSSSESGIINSSMKMRKGVVRVVDSVGPPNEAVMLCVKKRTVKH